MPTVAGSGGRELGMMKMEQGTQGSHGSQGSQGSQGTRSEVVPEFPGGHISGSVPVQTCLKNHIETGFHTLMDLDWRQTRG